MEPDSDPSHTARRPTDQGAGDLPEEEALRLGFPCPVGPGFIRLAQIEDQLSAAIRKRIVGSFSQMRYW